MKNRIVKLMKAEHLSPSKFAETIGVQRSNISHIISGRNKPSLEFVQRILSIYKNISSDWLIFGKGNMYREGLTEKDSTSHVDSLFEGEMDENDLIEESYETENEHPQSKNTNKQIKQEKIIQQKEKIEMRQNEHQAFSNIATELIEKKVERIVLFFSDKTFKEYKIVE